MLNKALRVQYIDVLFLFRFVISDIYRQLQEHRFSNGELNNLQHSIGEFVSMNSFFSMNTDRHRDMRFLNNSSVSDDLHRVLFVIEADPRVVKTKSFADIRLRSYFNNESQVLFMIGSIFCLMNIRRDDDKHDLKNLFDHMKKEDECDDKEIALLSFGNILHRMGKFNLAEKMYRRKVLECYNKAMELFQRNHDENHLYMAHTYHNIATIAHYNQSLKIKLKSLPPEYASVPGATSA